MSVLHDQETIGEAWARAVRRYGDRAFVAIPAGSAGAANGLELTYAQADSQIGRLIEGYRRAGYGPGHRAALLLENRVEHFLHKLALNAIGVSCLPINPDLRPAEIGYLVEHSEPEIVLTIGSRVRQAADALDASAHKPPMLIVEDGTQPPAPRRPAYSGAVTPATEASILYTSGTTGRPKGCILSHGYEIAAGAWYAQLPGVAGLRAGEDRIYNPLPLYHVNAGVLSLFGAICTGCCQVQPERFHAQRWWPEIVQSRATIVHYLGIVIQALMRQEDATLSRQHQVRYRPRRRRRTAAARSFRGPVRLPARRGLGHDRDGAGARGQRRAAPGRNPRVRARRVGDRNPGGRRGRPGRSRRHARRDALPPLGGDAAPRRVLRLPQERRGDREGVARRLVPHRRHRLSRGGRHAALRRSQEEHHSSVGREHRRSGSRSAAPGASAGGAGSGAWP